MALYRCEQLQEEVIKYDYINWLLKGRVNALFDSLDDLLNDEKTVRQLITVHDSVDYMIEWMNSDASVATQILNNHNIIKWVNLRDYALDKLEEVPIIKFTMDTIGLYGYGEVGYKNIVPSMTSNTVPYGVVTSDSQTSGYNNYYAFDNNSTTAWNSDYSQPRHYLCYQFIEAKVIDLFIGEAVGNALSGFTATVYASNNGNNWTKLGDSIRIEKSATNNERVKVTIPLDNNNAYTYYKIENLMDGNYWTGYYSAEFHSFEPLGLVPRMTSNTSPFGEAFANTTYGGYYPYITFIGENKPLYETSSDSDPNCWAVSGKNGYIGYKFVKPTEIDRISYIPRWATTNNANLQSPKQWKLEYSDDGNAWITVKTFTETVTTSPEIRIREVGTKLGYHIYWRMNITENLGANYTAVARLQFYGRQYKDITIPPMTSNSEPINTASASGSFRESDYPAWKMFGDTKNTLGWLCGTSDDWVQIKLDRKACVKVVATKDARNTSSQVNNIKFQASNDGVNFDTLSSTIILPSNTSFLYFDIPNNKEYTYYRFRGATNSVGHGWQCKLFGVDYSEREFEPNTSYVNIFDHGVSDYNAKDIYSSNVGGRCYTTYSRYIGEKTNNTVSSSWGTYASFDRKINLSNARIINCKYSDFSQNNPNSWGMCEMGITTLDSIVSNDHFNANAKSRINALTNGEIIKTIDVSKINEMCNIVWGIAFSASIYKFEISEVWLE